ncbi:hypothetical protein [Pseudonocardia sp. GCM10023141]|uniref:hypothetical protein n=1 Tax=Pseudonocardia sp. GCM10023141 TaxID=3252653 RepID=UPI003619AEC1
MTESNDWSPSNLTSLTYALMHVQLDDAEAPRRTAEAMLDGRVYRGSPEEHRQEVRNLLNSDNNLGFDENHSDTGIREFFRKVLTLLESPKPWPTLDFHQLRSGVERRKLDTSPAIGRIDLSGPVVSRRIERPFDSYVRGGVEYEIIVLRSLSGRTLALRAKPASTEAGSVDFISLDPDPQAAISEFEALTGIAVEPIYAPTPPNQPYPLI